MPDMDDDAPKPGPKNTILAIFGGMLAVYFCVLVYGLYRSLVAQKSLMQAIGDNGGALAIFAGCLMLYATSYAGRKK